MSEKQNVEDLDLSDAELMEVLKNHGIDRRSLMKGFGVTAGLAALGGTAAGRNGKENSNGKGGGNGKADSNGNKGGNGKGDSNGKGDENNGRGIRIDDVFGAPYSADDTVPSGLVDHVVELHVHGAGEDGEYEGFPIPDDAIDGDPMTPGFQPDSDDADDLPEFHFEPVGLHVKPGEIVEFKNISMEHTVSAFHPKFSNPFIEFPQRVPEDVPGFTSPPYVHGESWLYQFTEKGVYDVFCFPHLPLGMTMRIVVFDPEEDDPQNLGDYPDLGHPIFRNANLVLNTPELNDPVNIVNEMDGEVGWADLTFPPLPPSLPRPTIDELSLVEAGTSSSDAEFDVTWEVSDPVGLDTVHLTLNDMSDRETEDLACDVVSGPSASGTTRLVAAGDEGSGNDYQIELRVTNGKGLSVTGTATTTET